MSQAVVIDYTERGLRAVRAIKPLAMVWETTLWHPEPQWLLWAWCVPSGDLHAFAMNNIHSWTPIEAVEEGTDEG